MSLLDELAGSLSSANSNQEQGQGVLKLALDLINNPEAGGLGGLVKSFQEKGLGEIVSSWVGTGQNLPVSAEQIQNALGNNETIKNFIAKTGLSSEALFSSLSAVLPQVIDNLTPKGEIGEAGESNLFTQGLDLLKNNFLKPE
ncbi:hypothetical protein MTYM_00450 [Methylococcales bacterium]|nr:hypothetical protein MTYM_00450 [Methylococcales bacterium]